MARPPDHVPVYPRSRTNVDQDRRAARWGCGPGRDRRFAAQSADSLDAVGQASRGLTAMDFRRLLPEIRLSSPVCPRIPNRVPRWGPLMPVLLFAGLDAYGQ